MNVLFKKAVEDINQRPEAQQGAIAMYLNEHADEIIAQAEKEKRIATGTHTSDDFNEETKKGIEESEEEFKSGKLKSYKSTKGMFKDLGL